MSKLLQLRGGTTTEHATFTGALREVTVDTTKDTLVIHDGATVGGFPLPRTKADIDALNINADTLDGKQLATIESEYQSFANAAAAGIVDAAPATLDTLNELAAALGDDPNFATTVTNSIATKLPLAGGTLTGGLNVTSGNITAAGGSGDYNNTANVLTLNGTQHTRLLIDTASTVGHVAGLALESNGQLTNFTNSGNNSTIANDIGVFTIDSADDIVLDAGGSDILLRASGTTFGSLRENSSNFRIKSDVLDKDMLFLGNDGGSEITALTLDMSEGGYATFNNGMTLKNDIYINNADGSLTVGYLYNDSNDFIVRSYSTDKDIIFKGNDGGSLITALTLDMSAAGAATFNSIVNAPNFNTTSDATLKTNVETLTGSLDAVQALRGVSFDWIDNGGSEIGVIAQEVEAVLPALVNTNDEGIKSVKYGNMVAVLIEAVKELKAEIEELKKR